MIPTINTAISISQPNIEEFTRRIKIRLEERLEAAVYRQPTAANIDSAGLYQSMAYSLLNGGKRLRAMLVVAAYEGISNGLATSDVYDFAAAVECIHAYSLIHDDLPSMDDDKLRRGKPTNHIIYGEANAILAGDALQTLAFEIISQSRLSAQQRIDAIAALSKASGAKGMIAGQYYDLMSENQSLSLDNLKALHAHKTGALISASLRLGAIAADASNDQLDRLQQFGDCIGLAFQVIDDVLDIESDTETLGKQQGADIAANKATYPSILGIAASKTYAEELINNAIDALDIPNINSETLVLLARFITARKN